MNASIIVTMLTSLLSLWFFSPAIAADFSGTLKEVTITDAQKANMPPAAKFTYIQNETTVIFDASSSVDPDGVISEYKWDLGDGSTGFGVNFTHNYTKLGNYPVTLTVLDDKNGISIFQYEVKMNSVEKEIASDNFSSYAHGTLLGGTDKWVAILSDAITITSSYVRGYNSNGFSSVRIKDSASFTADQYCEVAINASSSSGTYGCSVRSGQDSNGKPYFYAIAASYKKIEIYSYNGSKPVGSEYTLLASTINYEPKAGDKIKLTVSGQGENMYLSGYYGQGSSENFSLVLNNIKPTDIFTTGYPGLAFKNAVSNSITEWKAGNI